MIRTAIVENIKDEKGFGRIQVRIIPELYHLTKDQLPWAKPKEHVSYKSQELPSVGDLVFAEINDDWTSFYFLKEAPFIAEQYPYSDIVEALKAIDELDNIEYPNPDFKLSSTGALEFYNKETGDRGYLHSSGTYILFKENGDLFIKKKEKFTLHFEASSGKVFLKDVESFEIGGAGDNGVLYTPLKSILDTIFSHTHVTSCPAGAGTASSSTSLATLSSSSIKAEKLKLE
jgi:hypothetical protein